MTWLGPWGNSCSSAGLRATDVAVAVLLRVQPGKPMSMSRPPKPNSATTLRPTRTPCIRRWSTAEEVHAKLEELREGPRTGKAASAGGCDPSAAQGNPRCLIIAPGLRAGGSGGIRWRRIDLGRETGQHRGLTAVERANLLREGDAKLRDSRELAGPPKLAIVAIFPAALRRGLKGKTCSESGGEPSSWRSA
jgi:hypothetical protein